jgi:predicted unusual protein kinase regulating ubiquinone biosynthesis (AarF/ABC1/UbiB family)
LQKINRVSLAEDLATLFQQSQELQPTEQEISGFILAIITVGERYGLHFPREFTLLLKQFLYFDRYIQLLTPELNLLSEGRILPFPVDLKE